MRIQVIVPTRGRPESATEVCQTFVDTVEDLDNTELLFVIDDDDPRADDYHSATKGFSETIHLKFGPRMRMGPTLNRAAVEASSEYAIVGFIGDDHRFRTKGWDNVVRDAVRRTEGSGIVYGDDLLQGINLPTAVFVTSDIIAILGYIAPPELIHMYLDNFWKDFGVEIDRLSYMQDVVIEHMHPAAGKAEWSEQYVELNSDSSMERDRVAYEKYKATRFNWDVMKYFVVVAALQSINEARKQEQEALGNGVETV